MSLYYKILNDETASYLSGYLLDAPPSGTIRLSNISSPYYFNELNKIDPTLTEPKFLASFKLNYLRMVSPSKSNIFGIQYRIGLPLLTRLHIKFSDLREHRFNHRFN